MFAFQKKIFSFWDWAGWKGFVCSFNFPASPKMFFAHYRRQPVENQGKYEAYFNFVATSDGVM